MHIPRTATAALCLMAALGGARQARAQIAIDAITGPITAHEITSFKQFMQTRSPGTTSWGGSHNALAFGDPGRDVEALGLMFEATGDVQILQRMVFFVDAFLGMRNDPVNGRVIWTGRAEPIWLPEAPDSPRAKYCASEGADTVAHIAYAAKLIAQTPALASAPVPGGDPHGYGATYLARAKTYLAQCDRAMDEYFTRWFVEAGTNLIREPKDPLWAPVATNVIAINRQVMFAGAYQRLAEAHELLGDAPPRVARYDAIARASLRESLDGMKRNPLTVSGHTVYKWSYFPDGTLGTENVAHGAYDVLAITRAWERRRVYGITLDEVVPFADTVTYVLSKGNNNFAATLSGSGSQNYILGEWIPVGQWNDTAYPLMAMADIASGRAATTPQIAAAILWTKQRLAGPPPRADGGAEGGRPDAAPDGGGTGGTAGSAGDAGQARDAGATGGAAGGGGAGGSTSGAGGSGGTPPAPGGGEGGSGPAPVPPPRVQAECGCRVGAGQATVALPWISAAIVCVLRRRPRRRR
jgi:hypothetical protein